VVDNFDNSYDNSTRAPGGASHTASRTSVRSIERGPRRLPKPDPRKMRDFVPTGPAVVALGGGHGLAAALTAVRRYAGSITAVVSVADDGGSSGRLRRDLDVPAPGDVRRCLTALAAEGTVWGDAFEHRFSGGELDGHALGNIVLVGLTGALGDFGRAIEEAGRLVKAVGRVLPATAAPVGLRAEIGGQLVEGQVAISATGGRIERVEIVPPDAPAHPDVVAAIELADQVVLAPGSLYTSLVPVLCVREIAAAVRAARGRVVQVCNLRPEVPETQGLDGTDHLQVVLDHGARVDAFVFQAAGALPVDETEVKGRGVEPIAADVARTGGGHDPALLAKVLNSLA